MKLFGAATSVRASPDDLAQSQRLVSSLPANDHALQTERARGRLMSHRDWLAANAARGAGAAMARMLSRMGRGGLPRRCRSFGLPATAAPIDKSPSGLPVGVQIIGAYLGDRTTIRFAELLEREFGGFIPPGWH